MKMLDQSEVDALLTSAESLAEEADPLSDVSSGALSPAQSSPAGVELPEDMKLFASEQAIERILPVQVPVMVRLAERQMRVDRLIDLTVGAIIEFDRPADAELDLVVANIPIGTGNAVKCGEKFGLRVIKIQPWAARALAMGLIR